MPSSTSYLSLLLHSLRDPLEQSMERHPHGVAFSSSATVLNANESLTTQHPAKHHPHPLIIIIIKLYFLPSVF